MTVTLAGLVRAPLLSAALLRAALLRAALLSAALLGASAWAQPVCDAPTPGAALLWNLNHGGVLSAMPTVPGTDWVLYIDNVIPLMSFAYPPTWQATNLTTGYYQVGVLLTSGDGSSAFEILQVNVPQPLSAWDVAQQGLQSLIGGSFETLCYDAFPGPGVIPNERGVLVGRAGDQILFASTQVFAIAGVFQADFRAVVAPSQRFDAVATDVVLPISVQLLVSDPDRGKKTGGSGDDSDGDGTPDPQDNYPNDPNRQ